MSQWSGPFSWWIPVSIAVFVTSIVAMTVSVLATGEAVSVAAHCSEEIEIFIKFVYSEKATKI